MFGQNDDNQQQAQNQDNSTLTSGVMQGFTPPPAMPPTPTPDPSDDSIVPDPSTNDTSDFSSNSEIEDTNDAPVLTGNLTVSNQVDDNSGAPEPATTAPTADDTSIDNSEDASSEAVENIPSDLLEIKQEALQELSPLVEHLEQSPEERFRTTMMMIQATDDSTKIREAYDAAQQIEDKKVRAQALLDVVNEINYFTQQKQAE